jgi:hypothetical protein
MHGNNCLQRFGPIGFIAFLAATMSCLGAPTIWNGPQISFTKLNGANPGLAANQDRITGSLWITRSSSQGLYNAETEAFFTHFSSPAGTLWADGSLANYSSLSYTDWNSWAKGVHAGPSSTVGINAVVHDTVDDIYFSIKFTSWTSAGAGGGFSYLRSTSVPEPAMGTLLVMGALVGVWKRKKRS